MSKKVISSVVALVMMLSLVLAGCGGSQAPAAKTEGTSTDKAPAASTNAKTDVKVGFIYVGPANDGGWSQAHDEGRKYLEEKLGVKTLYRENVPEGPECEKAITDLIDQGCNVIFTTSYGFMDPTEKVAKQYPNVKFFHCSGNKMAENMSNYFGKINEPRYLSGIVAGMKTKANKIGYVAAYETPEVISGINAFTLGVQSVNPNAKVIVKWTHTWIDAAKEKDAAIAALDEGCDVLAQHNDSPAPQIAAEQRGVWAIGYDIYNPQAAPKAYMTAPVFRWGPYYVEQVKAIMDGTWKASSYLGTMKDGVVDLGPLTSVAPEGAKEKVEAVKSKMLDGSFNVFSGPIKDQSGAVKVEAGKALTDQDVLSMMWFVQGVEGKIESK
ncbi:MAG: BMP family ABC transporter substrate-binding protein [Clostridiales bacterium]|jgi:basic membrane protein A|nr:BMP family ABC transporter substrate-binding protein [Eubacteriales bacterium]MDH7566555.1 BMP family ABC transporter substrate-binding protein [Clostridiales bacterium]